MDIETAPHKGYFWSTRDTYINPDNIIEPGYTLCYAARWHHKPGIIFGSAHRHGRKGMVQSVHKLLNKADAVCHFNGEKFDIPRLNSEFLLAGLGPPSPFKHIDLLKTCRKRFGFASNKLDYVCKVLGIGAKVHHKGMELWHGCMAGDDESWRVMESYNKGDVLLTQKLYDRLLPWIDNHPNVNTHAGRKFDPDRPRCPTCGSSHVIKSKNKVSLTRQYKQWQCQSAKCGRYFSDPKPVPL